MTFDEHSTGRKPWTLRGFINRGDAGFSVAEILVALSLFAVVSVGVLQAFVQGMGVSKKGSERAAATTLAIQLMEQVRASPNPYTQVGFTPITRQACCSLPSPWTSVINASSYPFDVYVSIVQDANMVASTVTVNVFRQNEANPLVGLTTMLKDK
jgi:type II secretory pathway pseudopilin PulG